LICGQLPLNSKLCFDSIVLSTKFPISIKEIKRGSLVKVPIGVVTPQKKTTFEGEELSGNTLVKKAYLRAKMISASTKARGSKNHHKFSYKIKRGEIIMRGIGF
tara:strand:- start:122 stop:433 length:312 start_codon:yes stop_codon:yes gene_type:complete